MLAQHRTTHEVFPSTAVVLRDFKGLRYDIHHCIPLEYAHLFPLRDVNAGVNLVAAARPVHASVNGVWARLRKAPRAPTDEEVLHVEGIVRKHFGRWFNKVHEESAESTAELAGAKAAALEEVNALIAAMR